MIQIGAELKQETRCHGNVNGHEFEVVGGGTGRPFDGMVATSLKSTKGELPFPTAFLSPVLIMGYPTFSNYHQRAFDLFKLSDGYEYERHFKFKNGGTMNCHHRIKYDGDKLTGDFHIVDANVEIPNIIHCEPTVETFIPAGPGKIQSKFTLGWRIEGGGLFMTEVDSEYRLTHNAALPHMQFRYITFDTQHGPDYIKQTESLNVFRDLDGIRK